MVGFVDDDDFEALLRVEVDLLGLGDFFEEFLHDDSVVVADVGRGDFEVVDGGDDVEFELAVAGGLEDSGVDLDLFDAGAVEGAQGGEDAGLFACAGWTEEEEMGEVGRGGLEVGSWSVLWPRRSRLGMRPPAKPGGWRDHCGMSRRRATLGAACPLVMPCCSLTVELL